MKQRLDKDYYYAMQKLNRQINKMQGFGQPMAPIAEVQNRWKAATKDGKSPDLKDVLKADLADQDEVSGTSETERPYQ